MQNKFTITKDIIRILVLKQINFKRFTLLKHTLKLMEFANSK